jgi:hypothetical protein
MKLSIFAIGVALLFALILIPTVSANSSVPQIIADTDTPTPTETETPTPTETLTPTATFTPDPCAVAPGRPKLIAPARGAQLQEQQVLLDWKNMPCQPTYAVEVRQGSPSGKVVDSASNLSTSKHKTTSLARGHTYYWHVTACIVGGCNQSKVRHFTILVPPTSTPVPTATPHSTSTPSAFTGQHVVCHQNGSAQICASVSNGSPSQYTDVTVNGRLLISGAGQGGLTMDTTWHYKTTTSYCSATTNTNGVASCTRYISGATIGYQVNIDVTIDGYTATTWFTPQ